MQKLHPLSQARKLQLKNIHQVLTQNPGLTWRASM
jgi:hypothetical protein